MRKAIVTLLVLIIMAVAVGAAAGSPVPIEPKESGTMVIGGTALAAPDTPDEAVEYAAALLGR